MDIPALAFCNVTIQCKVPLPKKYPKELKSIGDHLLKRRFDLKLSQPQVAKIIGVTTDTITFWENRRTRPQIQFSGKIIEFLGYNPCQIDVKTFGGKLKKCRLLYGLSQRKLAKLLKIDPSTVADWEENRSKPQRSKEDKILKYFGSLF